MLTELNPVPGLNTGAVTEANPRFEDKRLPDYLQKIGVAFDKLGIRILLPNELIYGYVQFGLTPTFGMTKCFPIFQALQKAQWCLHTPPNGSDQIKTSDYRPKFMICEIPTAWERDMITAHIACLLLILNGEYQVVMQFLYSPDNLNLKSTISSLLNVIDLPRSACTHIEHYADRLSSCHFHRYALLNSDVGTQIKRRRQDKRRNANSPTQSPRSNSHVKFM